MSNPIGRIPYRMALAGGWIDQPFVSRLNPDPPGSMVVVGLEPTFRFMDRAGMATSTRRIAEELWNGALPEKDPVALVRELYEAENKGKADPSGSQDMAGLILPGINRLDYDYGFAGGLFPAHIESCNDPDVGRWLEETLHVLPVAQRPVGYSPLGEQHLNAEWVRRLGQSGKACFAAILAKDTAKLGASLNECMSCWEALLPNTVAHPLITVDLLGLLAFYQERYAGAMYSGCGGGYLYVVSEEPVPGAAKVKVRLAERATNEKRTSIREVAKRAKVSTATVSRVINRVPTVEPLLARRVRRVVDELGYYPNIQARALVSGKSKTFGLIVSELTNPFFPEIVQAFGDIAVQHQYEILFTSTAHDPKLMESSVRRMIERSVDGVAVMTFGMEELLLEDLKSRQVPLVFVDVGPPLPRVSNIRIDYLHGIRQAVQHLAALRHERIAFITGPLGLKSAVARRDAFLESMEEIGLTTDPRLIVEGDHTTEGGMEAAANLLKARAKPTAILCSNDMTAFGVMRKSYEDGVVIPRDVSLVGFDDVPLTQFMLPPLTTVQMSQAELASLAFKALLAEVERGKPTLCGTEYTLRTNLVLRKSTAMAAT